MNISKKALMSFIMALTSVVSMAQPYYHVMKRDGSNQTEEAVYDAKTYKIKVDMDKPRPKDAIGGKITMVVTDCKLSELKRSFYFTKNGNVYYNKSEDKFYFEKSQLDYPSGRYNKDHIGHFNWGRSIEECTNRSITSLAWPDGKETDFFFANPDTLERLQKDLGKEDWIVLSACEWSYVYENLGEYGWQIDGEPCFLIDTTPYKSLLRTIESNNGGKTMSKADFEYYEAQGLVCLPAVGELYYSSFYGQGYSGYYWTCTPSRDKTNGVQSGAYFMQFTPKAVDGWHGPIRTWAQAVRLVVLAD